MPYEKVGKDETVCIADEVPFEIPESWEWVRLGKIVYNRGQMTPINDFCYIDIGSINNNNQKLSNEENIIVADKAPSRARKIVSVGDILYSTVRPYLHNMCIIDRSFSHQPIASTGFATLTCHTGYCNEFLFYYLMSPDFDTYANDTDNAKGIAYPAINDNKLYQALIPVPPESEQKRIVEKIKEVLPCIEAYRAAYSETEYLNSTFPERLRKSILQEAVQGKLVPQDENEEPASVLLERIRAEKQRLIKEGKIKKDKHESIIFRRDNSHYEKCGSEEDNVDEIIPFDLPDSWEWIRLSTILTSTDAGKSPKCENRPRINNDWGVIKTTAVQDGYFLADENKVLPINFNIQRSMIVQSGDLLITRSGPRNRTGIICVVEGDPKNLILSDKTVRLSYLRGFVNPHYIMTALSSPAMQCFVVNTMTGMAASQVNISQEKMKTFLLPLPPLNEQQRIVDEVRKVFACINTLNF